MPQDLPLHEWALTEETEPPCGFKSWMNLLARKTFRLVHPADAVQVLYCYSDKLPTPDGQGEWRSRFGHSAQARDAVYGAWEPQDGPRDDDHAAEVAALTTLRRCFRDAAARRKEAERHQQTAML